ncbi:unnamed protein product [Musa acuminata subsp. malaccensis]|uniref:(wild Malaysian banana) hypothetical protein n=1 Tax=Musa acuminata subsp. malaccensis TaxID=214687 RepID=A0A804KAC6_MUSAM|nr:unnamed protein product [Musa acuminata subsp. malaccensis]
MGRYTCSTRCSRCAFVIGRTWITSSLASNISASNTSYKRSNFPHRIASQLRFREKMKERNFDKKIWYAVWKEGCRGTGGSSDHQNQSLRMQLWVSQIARECNIRVQLKVDLHQQLLVIIVASVQIKHQ